MPDFGAISSLLGAIDSILGGFTDFVGSIEGTGSVDFLEEVETYS